MVAVDMVVTDMDTAVVGSPAGGMAVVRGKAVDLQIHRQTLHF